MNKDEFTGKWRQIRGKIKSKWGQLTDNDLDKIEGNYDMLIGKIQERTGRTRAEIERDLDALETDTPVRRPL